MKNKLTQVFSITLILLSGLMYAQDGPSAEELAKANNPLASSSAFNIQNYYSSNIFGNGDATSNSTFLRYVTPTGKILWRASLPFNTISTGAGSKSGLGDADIFAAYLAKSDAKLTIGFGPSLGLPTASDDATGTGKWSGGLAVVAFAAPSADFQFGALAIWRVSFAGKADRDKVHFAAFQPFYFWQLGGGLYIRGAPTWNFNIETGSYNIPMGLGIGKVFKTGNKVFNFFVEPQYSVLHYGSGQPALQWFMGMNMQF
jgi:hypothetical protein